MELVPNAAQGLLEQNLRLKLAIRTLQERLASRNGEFTRNFGGDWETTLFSPLGQEDAPDSLCDCTVSHSSTFQAFPMKASPQHSLTRNINSSLGSLSVSLISTNIESQDDLGIEEGGSQDHSQYDDDIASVRIRKESSEDLLSCPRILNHNMMQFLHNNGLPITLRDNEWERCFAIGRDGDSFVSFLERTSRYQQTLIVIQTTKGSILGGFATQSWQVQDGYANRYYGTGQSFLFSQTNPKSQVQLYKWSGVNDFCQISDESEGKIAMGGGGSFGLIVEDGFWRGQTGPCKTYSNPPLVPGGFFEIAAFEVFGLVPFSASFHSIESF